MHRLLLIVYSLIIYKYIYITVVKIFEIIDGNKGAYNGWNFKRLRYMVSAFNVII